MSFNDDDKLRRADKAVSGKADTDSSKESWQELLARHTSLPAVKSLQAARVIGDLAGSWAARFSAEIGQKSRLQSEGDTPEQTKINRIGQPGMPEIDFRPYDHNTPRFGSKGPSLLGHPISFSVVGPTLKSPYLDLQWVVTDNTGTVNGDVLTIDAGRNVFTGAAAPTTETIEETYGFSSLASFPGGLYLVIAQTGAEGSLTTDYQGTTATEQLGDGFIFEDAGPDLREAITPLDENSKFEIFRVTAVGADSLTLDPNKRLSSYFNIPSGSPPTPVVRAITLFEPHVSRLAAIPGSGAGVGRERAYVVLPPARTANADLMPPYDGGTPGDGTFLQGGFDELDPGDAFSAPDPNTGDYGEKALTPIPRPIANKRGRVWGNISGSTDEITGGRFNIIVRDEDVDANDQGRIIHVYQTDKIGDSTLIAHPYGQVSEDYFLGWFEVLDVSAPILGPATYTLKKVPTFDPVNGRVTHALEPSLNLDNVASGVAATATLTVLTAPTTGTSISLSIGAGLITLSPAGGARTPGSDDYDDTLGSPAAISAEITAALNDPANSFHTLFTATDLGGSVEIESDNPGIVGNDYTLTESSGGTDFSVDDFAGGEQDDINLSFTTHDPVDSIFTRGYFDLDLVESARLTNLIDPSWAARSPKTGDKGNSAARADRAIFNTTPDADPGSLLDLGFRMVLYPATGDASNVVTDWDNPITSNEVTLDPSLSESQCWRVDYDSGVVWLSHDPVPGAGCDVAPNGIVGTNGSNPRGEIVLFAACVPYSREKGQTSASPRVRSIDADGQVSDAFGARVVAPIKGQVDGSSQSIVPGRNVTINLAVTPQDDPFPATGFVDLMLGSSPLDRPYGRLFNDDKARGNTFGYYRKTFHTDSATGESYVRLEGSYGGVDPTVAPAIFQDGQYVATLRKDVLTPQTKFDKAGTNYVWDTTYGSSARAESLTFDGAEMEADNQGGLRVNFPRMRDNTALFGDLFSNWLISGGDTFTATSATDQYNVSSSVVLVGGVRHILPETTLWFGNLGTEEYVVVNTNDPEYPYYTVSSSMPTDDSILIAHVSNDGAGTVTNIQDLRSPLTNMDRRLDILVGKTDGFTSQTTHFETLGEAINYVSEIMDPTNGNDGSYLRIKVVGYTDEIEAGAPYAINASGLLIEGAGMRFSGLGNNHGIRCAFDPSFIDLNGSRVTFRDLTMEWIDPSSGDTTASNRNFFVGDASDARFYNIQVDGNGFARGFAYLDSAQNTTVRDCIVRNVTDWGVYVIGSGSGLTNDFRILDSFFDGDSGVSGLSERGGVRLPDGSTSTNCYIRGCTIQNFRRGITTYTRWLWVTDNIIASTLREGLVLENNTTGTTEINVRDNILFDVWTDSGTKTAVDFNAFDSVFSGNTVRLNSAGVGDIDFRLDGLNNRVHHNKFETGDVSLSSEGSIFESNKVALNIDLNSPGMKILSNVVTGSVTTVKIGDIEFSGNTVDVNVQLNADDCIVRGNRISGDLDLSQADAPNVHHNVIGGDVDIDQTGYIVLGNNIGGSIDNGGSPGTDPDAANGIVVANNVGGNIFGVAPGGTPKDNNV